MKPTERTTQQQYLQTMGVEVWRRRGLESVEPPSTSVPAASHKTISEVARPSAGPTPVADRPSTPVLSSVPEPRTAPVIAGAAVGRRSYPGDWSDLRKAVAECRACDLHRSRIQTVFGVGDVKADWMLVGEAPGGQEDRQGEPFVGPAGKLLDAMLLAVGRTREQVYIANILKCRPPGNRDPSATESACCRPYLERQIELLSPRVIMAVGRVAAQNLLATEQTMRELRGRVHHYGAIPLVVGYHPAYLLRSPGEKRKAWQDLLLVLRVLESPP